MVGVDGLVPRRLGALPVGTGRMVNLDVEGVLGGLRALLTGVAMVDGGWG